MIYLNLYIGLYDKENDNKYLYTKNINTTIITHLHYKIYKIHQKMDKITSIFSKFITNNYIKYISPINKKYNRLINSDTTYILSFNLTSLDLVHMRNGLNIICDSYVHIDVFSTSNYHIIAVLLFLNDDILCAIKSAKFLIKNYKLTDLLQIYQLSIKGMLYFKDEQAAVFFIRNKTHNIVNYLNMMNLFRNMVVIELEKQKKYAYINYFVDPYLLISLIQTNYEKISYNHFNNYVTICKLLTNKYLMLKENALFEKQVGNMYNNYIEECQIEYNKISNIEEKYKKINYNNDISILKNYVIYFYLYGFILNNRSNYECDKKEKNQLLTVMILITNEEFKCNPPNEIIYEILYHYIISN